MPFKISVADLRARIEKVHFANQGDAAEQQYWPVFKERFPHLETFWRWCVVPLTSRIERAPGSVPIMPKRDGVANDLWQISFRHYSGFCHFSYAYERLRRIHETWASSNFIHISGLCATWLKTS
jgi:hypothetical protein